MSNEAADRICAAGVDLDTPEGDRIAAEVFDSLSRAEKREIALYALQTGGSP